MRGQLYYYQISVQLFYLYYPHCQPAQLNSKYNITILYKLQKEVVIIWYYTKLKLSR